MKKLFSKMNLATKLFICYTIPLLIIMVSYILIAGFNQKNIQHQSLIDHHISINKEVLRHIESETNAMSSLFSVIYTDTDSLLAVLNGPSVVGYYEGSTNMKALTHHYLYLTPQKENYVLLDLDGNIYLAGGYDGTFVRGQAAAENLWPRELLEQGNTETYITVSTHPELSVDVPCINLYRAVRDPETKKIIAVSLVYERLNRLEPNILNAVFSEDEIVQITDQNGVVIYNNLGHSIQAEVIRPIDDIYVAQIDGKQYMQIANTSKTLGWTISVYSPYSRWPGSEMIFSNSNVGTVVVLLLASFLSAFAFSQTITKPLSALVVKMKDFGEGHFSKVDLIDSTDEVSVISQTYNNMVDRLKLLIHDKYELTALKSQAELDALQHQINPHFLFNTLNSIKSICILHDDEVASKMVQTLADLLRTSINNGSSLISFEQEIRQIERYIFLQKYRFGDKFNVTYEIAPQTLQLQVPGLTLQPLVENVFQHGLSLKTSVCQITISAQKTDDVFFVRISNSGTVPEEKLQEVNRRLQDVTQKTTEHIGMINVRRRLCLYFGEDTGMRMLCENGNTVVELWFPACESGREDAFLERGHTL